MWQTPVSRVSPRNSTPAASSSARAAATSGTRSATPDDGTNSIPTDSGIHIPSVTLAVSYSGKTSSSVVDSGSPSSSP